MTNEKKETRKSKLTDIELKQNTLFEMITSLRDDYNLPSEALIISNLKNATDELHKLRQKVAIGNEGENIPDEAKSDQIKELIK